MPLSFAQYAGDGVTDLFNVPFGYLSQSHVQVKVNGVLDPGVVFLTAQTVRTSSVPPLGAVIDVRRVTPNASRLVDFADGSLLGEADLDTSALQVFYVMQEVYDDLVNRLSISAVNVWDALNKRLSNLADGVDPTDAATVGQTVGVATAAQAAQQAALSAQAAAESAQTGAELARDMAIQARDDAQAAASAIHLPDPNGNALNYLRQNAAEDGFEYRTPAQVRGDLSLGALATLDVAGAGQLGDGAVGAAQLADGAVTAAKLAPGVVAAQALRRNTVLSGFTDANGKPAFLGLGTGLQPQALASGGSPLAITAANGFTADGKPDDRFAALTANQLFPACAPGCTNYLYADIDAAGAVTLGATQYPWTDGERWQDFDAAQKILVNCDAAPLIDQYGNASGDSVWIRTGGATVSAAAARFGANGLDCGASGKYVQLDMQASGMPPLAAKDHWGVGFWFQRKTSAGANGYVVSYPYNASYNILGIGVDSGFWANPDYMLYLNGVGSLQTNFPENC